MVDEATNRKRAYHYIAENVREMNWNPPINSDKRLADILDISIDELNSLKEGTSDPSDKLVITFKDLASLIISDTEIESYLVEPFRKQ